MSTTFSLEKAYEEMAQLQRMEQIENGTITFTIENTQIECPTKAIVGARVQNGFPIEIDVEMNGSKHTIREIGSCNLNDQEMTDLIALFEYNMHNTIENGITSQTQITSA